MIGKPLISTAVLGATVMSVTLASSPAQSASIGSQPSCSNNLVRGALTIYRDFSDGICPAASDWSKLFSLEARNGRPGKQDYEFALGQKGANNPLTPSQILYRDWTEDDNSVALTWHVTFDKATKVAQFFLDSLSGGAPLTYTSTASTDIFNAFSIYAKATNSTPDIQSILEVTKVSYLDANNLPVSTGTAGVVRVEAVSGTKPFNQISVASSREIKRVDGILLMAWPLAGDNPNRSPLSERSNTTVVFEAFDPPIPNASGVPAESGPLQAAPEPFTLLGTGTAISFGAYFKKRVTKANKKR